MNTEFDWKHALEQLFSATLNQEPIEEACELLVSISLNDESYHEECLFLFKKGNELIDEENSLIIDFINKSGYQIASFDDAREILTDFERTYLDAYGAALG